MLPQPAPTDFSAASMFAKVCTHWASKLSTPTILPSRSTPTWPAMKTNSDAFTRVRCEYCPSGLPSASGLRILMSAILDSSCLRATANPLRELLSFHLHAARHNRLFPLLNFTLDEIAQPLRAALICCRDGRAKLGKALLHRKRRDGSDRRIIEFLYDVGRRAFRQE